MGRTFLRSAEIFDPATNTMTRAGSMNVPRESHTADLLGDGSVLIVGGHSRDRQMVIHASAELFDPALGTFSLTGPMHRPRHKHAAIAIDAGHVLVTGGADERDEQGQYDDAELFDAARREFITIGRMLHARYKHAGSMVFIDSGKVLLAGGSAQAESYDVTRREFAAVGTSPPFAGSFSAVAALQDGSILVTGGYGNGTGPPGCTLGQSRDNPR